MIAATYFRVSTENQDTTRQKIKVEEYAKNNGYKLVAEFEDKLSGGLEERPAFIELQNWIQQHNGSALIIAELDRTARNIYVYSKFRKLCQENDVKLIFLNVPQTGNASIDTLIETILAGIAEYMKTDIVTRMFGGRISKVKQNMPLMGRVPYGYFYLAAKDNNGKPEITVNQEEATIVKEIFHLYVDEQWGTLKIGRYLNKKGIKTKAGKVWQSVTLKYLLQNEAYIGNLYFGKKHKVSPTKRKSVKVPKEQWIKIECPRIIDDEVFQKAQELFKRVQHQPQNRKYDYLLTGIVRCGVCGRLYTAYKAGNSIRFYRCGSRTKLDENGNIIFCRNHTANADRLDPKIWEIVKEIVTNPKKTEQSFLESKEKMLKSADYLNNKLEGYIARIETIDDRKKRLLDGYSAGVIPLPTYSEKIKEEDTNQGKWLMLANETKEMLNQVNAYIKEYDLLKHTRIEQREVKDIDSLKFEERQKLVKKYIKNVIVRTEAGKYTIEYLIPTMKSKDITVKHRRRYHDNLTTAKQYQGIFFVNTISL